jgi:hypothetical protein
MKDGDKVLSIRRLDHRLLQPNPGLCAHNARQRLLDGRFTDLVY